MGIKNKVINGLSGIFPKWEQMARNNADRKYLLEYFRENPGLQEKYPEEYKSLRKKVSKKELKQIETLIVEYESEESDKQYLWKKFCSEEKLRNKYPDSFQKLQGNLSGEEIEEIKKQVIEYRKGQNKKARIAEYFQKIEGLPARYSEMLERLQGDVTDEEIEEYEKLMEDYAGREDARERLKNYLDNNPRLKVKYEEIYERLQKELSWQEYREVSNLVYFEMFLFQKLIEQYNWNIEKTIEHNFKSGKVERLYPCKSLGIYEEALKDYPEEVEEIVTFYSPEFAKIYFDSEGKVKWENISEIMHMDNPQIIFKDMQVFEKFLEKHGQDMYRECIITDKEYNSLKERISGYLPSNVGSALRGTYTAYFLSYESYLKVKEKYPGQVSKYAKLEYGDRSVIEFIRLIDEYLEKHEAWYIV